MESMYPLWHTEGDSHTAPNLTVLEAMNLDGDEYDALKRELSQPVEQAVSGVSKQHETAVRLL